MIVISQVALIPVPWSKEGRSISNVLYYMADALTNYPHLLYAFTFVIFGFNYHIFVTGNTAIDALKSTVVSDYSHPVLESIGEDNMILLTSHRRENLGKPMENIFKAVKRIVNENPGVKVVYPVHLNPVVKEIADRILGNDDRIRLIEPLGVRDFHNFSSKAHIILTDSGGIQEEAPSLGKPVLVLRDTTERPEGMKAGTLKLVGTDEEAVYKSTNELLNNQDIYERMSKASNPYGDGYASKRIIEAILFHFDKSKNKPEDFNVFE